MSTTNPPSVLTPTFEAFRDADPTYRALCKGAVTAARALATLPDDSTPARLKKAMGRCARYANARDTRERDLRAKFEAGGAR